MGEDAVTSGIVRRAPAQERSASPGRVAPDDAGRTVVDRARSCVGAPFRAQGREAALGLDCVGLAVTAFGCAAPANYAMRLGDVSTVARMIAAAGLVRVEEAQPGDLLLFRSGPGQLHLGIATGDGVIHADGAAGRVIERPGALPWPVTGIWREG